MAVFVLRDAAVRIAGVLFSDHIQSVTVQMSAAEVDFTAMGSAGTKRAQGIRDDRFTLTAFSDFAASSIDATIYPIFAGASEVLVEVWANGTTTSATNPKFYGSAILVGYNPLDGGAGDASMTPLEFPVNGLITRATA